MHHFSRDSKFRWSIVLIDILGLPAKLGTSKCEVFGYLKDRMWARIKGWGERNLSMAGREVLIKSVLQVIPTYTMSCFLLPREIIQEAKRIVRR